MANSSSSTALPRKARKAPIRLPGVHFDLEGTKTPFLQLVEMGGLFPIERIADRLPFPATTLRKLAQMEPFADCFVSDQGGDLPTLIHLDLFGMRFDAMAQRTMEQDRREEFASIPFFRKFGQPSRPPHPLPGGGPNCS